MLADVMEKLHMGQWRGGGFDVEVSEALLRQFDAWLFASQCSWYVGATPPIICGEAFAPVDGVNAARPAGLG